MFVEPAGPEALSGAPAYAVLPPRLRSRQPWELHREPASLRMTLKAASGMAEVDPDVLVECGVALENIRLALRHFGCEERVELVPGGESTAAVAHIGIQGARVPDGEDERLFLELHPGRPGRELREVPGRPSPALVGLFRHAARMEGAWLEPVRSIRCRAAIAETLLGPGATNDPSIQAREGSLAMGTVVGALGGAVLRGGPRFRSTLALRRFFEDAPLLAVLGTAGATNVHWIQVGEALQRVNLHASVQGLVLSVFQAPLRSAAVRDVIRNLLVLPGEPQLVARFDFGTGPTLARLLAHDSRAN